MEGERWWHRCKKCLQEGKNRHRRSPQRVYIHKQEVARTELAATPANVNIDYRLQNKRREIKIRERIQKNNRNREYIKITEMETHCARSHILWIPTILEKLHQLPHHCHGKKTTQHATLCHRPNSK
jgi:hypothetical protein